MEITIRKAEIKDSDTIAELSMQLGYISEITEVTSRLSKIIPNNDNCVFTALNKDKIVGWIHAFLSLRVESESFVEIGGLVVDENFRNNGIGKKLIAEVYNWAKFIGISKVRVRCNIKRLETHEFYKNIDFVETKEQKIFDLKLK